MGVGGRVCEGIARATFCRFTHLSAVSCTIEPRRAGFRLLAQKRATKAHFDAVYFGFGVVCGMASVEDVAANRKHALRFASRLTGRGGGGMAGGHLHYRIFAARRASSERSLFASVMWPTMAWSFIRSME